MDTRSTTSEPQHQYPRSLWTAISTPASNPLDSVAQSQSSTASPPDTAAQPAPASAAAHFLPLLFPQQTAYHAQLLDYNKLISPARGGGLQTPPLPPVVSSSHVQAGPRSRSSSRVSSKDAPASTGATAGGHGSQSHRSSDKNNRPVMTPQSTAKHSPEGSRSVPQRSNATTSFSHAQSHSSSVPSTPRQRARQFSFESREPSPSAGNNPSPRSAYSESSSTLPSLRPLPPRLGGCKYETAQVNSRRRIPYSVGNDRLEKLDLRTVKNKLTGDEEATLATDMSEVYERLLPTPRVEEKRKRLVLKLETIFNQEWPGHDIRVNLFGSSGNLLCSDDSDLDICITTAWRELECVCNIAELLARRGMENVVCISAAKVPIVKIWDPELGLACDMNVNNTLALENTRMVRVYVEADPRVRELAMIVKYWTRRRVVNDAAFGGTLSSYTWICLIIAFLQLRNPPVLPALHQMPHKLPKSNGTASEFADNLKKIKGFGGKNRSSVADLLFQFFRFYAHEFDYDKYVLSIRQGKLVTKQEKKWNYAVNNQLCVEEPFNTSRNLGNTADEYSFRGLHLELRRAFDLLSLAKLEEACEQYVFPKEEERVWTRPAPQSRPVLLRSSSQTHSTRAGRGNYRGGRHNGGYHRNGGSSGRRASSGVAAYDPNVFMASVGMHQDVAWFPGHAYQFQYAQQELVNQMAYQESMRQYQLLAQSPALMQQHQVVGQPQRVSGNSGSIGQPTGDRSRTNSFDNVPVGAPLRPDLYALYGMNLGSTMFPQNGFGTYPSTPTATATSGVQGFRRSLQRSTVSSEGGAPASSSSLRSQSQPAQRSPSANPGMARHALGSQTAANATTHVSMMRNLNGVAIPSFMSDDVDFDETPKTASGFAEPTDATSAGFFNPRNMSPTRQSASTPQQQQQQQGPNGIAFGDLAVQPSGTKGRRLSTDQLPQTLLDRRIRRASRSPSPMGHARAYSVGGGSTSSAPLASAPFPGGQANRAATKPLVVNGSGFTATAGASPRGTSGSRAAEVLAREDSSSAANMDNALHISGAAAWSSRPLAPTSSQQSSASQVSSDRPPIVVNGSNAPLTMPYVADEASFRERIAVMNSFYLSNQLNQQEPASRSNGRLMPSGRQRLMSRQPQNGVIAPLDLAVTDPRDARDGSKSAGSDTAHLSPVFETRTTPSSSTFRRQEWAAPTGVSSQGDAELPKEPEATRRRSLARAPQATAEPNRRGGDAKASGPGTKTGSQREGGHVRSARSEGDGGWQKAAGKGKKKVSAAAAAATLTAETSHAEKPPRNDNDRKGG